MKKFSLLLAVIVLASIVIPASIALAAAHDDGPTTVFACLKDDGTTVDPATITLSSPDCIAPETLTSWNVQGPQGDPGKDGPTGATGPKGDTGAVGAQGPKGDAGDPGKDGTNGTNGTDGAPGGAGPKGDTGAQGAQGAPGLSGYVVVYSPKVTLNPGQAQTANCPAGDMALGGGVELGTTYSNFSIILDRINTSHHGWQGAYNSVNGTKTTIQVSAVCAKVA